MLELEAEMAVELPERSLMRHKRHKSRHHHHHSCGYNSYGYDRGYDNYGYGGGYGGYGHDGFGRDGFGGVHQSMNNFAFANAVGFGSHATAANFSIGNVQNAQSFGF